MYGNYLTCINFIMLDRYFNKTNPSVEPMDVEKSMPHEPDSPWVEKYRPNRIDELSHQDEVIRSLSHVLHTGNLPHLLFYGPAGTGKTSAIIALAKQLYGSRFYAQRILELNASDERGIAVVREKVKKFAERVCVQNTDTTFSCPDFKIIILDEADLMTSDAQSALRRIIEDNSKSTRFCLICNYVTKIIEPLASRCVKFRFKPIPFPAQVLKLKEIASAEGVSLSDKQIEMIATNGDLRHSINSLQILHRFNKIPENLLPVTQRIAGEILERVSLCSSIQQVCIVSKGVMQDGYAYDQLLESMLEIVLKSNMGARKKAILLEMLGSAEESLLQGAVELTITEVLTSIYYATIIL